MRVLKAILISVFLILIASSASSEVRLYLFGKANFVASSGSESDYEPGENDFPLTSSHKNYGAGFGLTLGSTLFIGIEGHYNLNGKAILTDSSDNDTVEVDTEKYISGFLTVGLNIIKSRSLRLYISGGGGSCRYSAGETRTYVSKFGYETEIYPPEEKSCLAGFGGAGLELYINQSSGLVLAGRYLYLSLEQPQTVLMAMAGLIWKF